MTTLRLLMTVMTGLFTPLVMAGGCNRCGGDKPPPPLEPTEASTTSTPDVTVIQIEDAGDDGDSAADAEADAKKPGGSPSATLTKCCQAIQQNAASAVEPTKTAMNQAAAACFAAVKSGQSAGSISAIAAGVGVKCR